MKVKDYKSEIERQKKALDGKDYKYNKAKAVMNNQQLQIKKQKKFISLLMRKVEKKKENQKNLHITKAKDALKEFDLEKAKTDEWNMEKHAHQRNSSHYKKVNMSMENQMIPRKHYLGNQINCTKL